MRPLSAYAHNNGTVTNTKGHCTLFPELEMHATIASSAIGCAVPVKDIDKTAMQAFSGLPVISLVACTAKPIEMA